MCTQQQQQQQEEVEEAAASCVELYSNGLIKSPAGVVSRAV